ncbi:GNAT family N-acetyltransferase [Vibrio rumoiensis]|uniref:Uncharacterized protein n=1 Tax=Vibrio rumoiensis 1S-45 TaxID=1188252 RepID=A0A1E5E4U5_9VIBR|nr:GNAT family N-acetyltransferase [Vibrio rumoiensis]OEF28149.1 hypothetical protein A1QC_05775 [Vibrio rumoiensis 1S-45]
MSALDYLNQLTKKLSSIRHRSGVVLNLNEEEQSLLLDRYIESQQFTAQQVAALGSTVKFKNNGLVLNYNQGQQLLGREVSMLVVDCHDGFDANSFTAALGALIGGGLVFIINFEALPDSNSKVWLDKHLQSWTRIDDVHSVCEILSAFEFSADTHFSFDEATDDQVNAINSIKRVLSGHRKRPLVINANRGRGKTASLGMAAIELMVEKRCHIIVTAPARKSIEPMFTHIASKFPQLSSSLHWVKQNKSDWQLSNGSTLSFMAPDDLLLNRPNADLLLVDEAAALPLSSLQAMVSLYHRCVFSTTIHGYEGCGRGFTLKFMAWLDEHRPGWKQIELTQPIRWNEHDPLELWLFNTFLLDADKEVASLSCLVNPEDVELVSVQKHELLANPNLFHDIFGLLVNAHYQTSPNDLTQVLDDETIDVIQIQSQGIMVGCLLLNFEGGLDDQTIMDIQLGKRRPKGQLAASYLANHLALSEPAQQHSARVMRIAISPSYQGQGIGSKTLHLLKAHLNKKVDFISVSFGATSDLVNFWGDAFQTVSLGTKRDTASGCYSVFMVCGLSEVSSEWVEQASNAFISNLQISLPFLYPHFDSQCLLSICRTLNRANNVDKSVEMPILVAHYARGGNSYESVLGALYVYLWNLLIHADVQISENTPCVLEKVLFNKSWHEVSHKYNLNGRKETELYIRQFLLSKLDGIR